MFPIANCVQILSYLKNILIKLTGKIIVIYVTLFNLDLLSNIVKGI